MTSNMIIVVFLNLGIIFSQIASCASDFGPRILTHPEDTTVPKNDPVTLRCEAEGDPEPEITWWRNGDRVLTAADDHKSHRVLLPNGSLFFLRAVQSRKEQDGGVYRCRAENSEGTVQSGNATLTIAVLRDKFREEPEDIEVISGQNAKLICSPPKGNPTPTVFWRKDGKDLSKDERISVIDDGSLIIKRTTEGDEGYYQCFAKNIVGLKASEKAKIVVGVPPRIFKAPENASVIAGKDISLACVARGKPNPEIRWTRLHNSLPPNRARVRGHFLILKNAVTSDEGIYRCIAENSFGFDSASASVQIHSPPIFLVEPSNQKVAVKAPVSLDCIAAGNPTPILFWMKEGDARIFLPGNRYSRLSVTPEGTLKIPEVDEFDTGYYSCVAASESGSCLRRTRISLQRESDKPPPIIQLGPVNQTLPLGSRTALPCQASSQDTILWLKDGVPLTANDRDQIKIEKDNTLVLKDLSLSDSGLYTCQARSASGQSVWSSSLTVSEDPGVSYNYMPDLSEFPGSPSKPGLANATSHSLTIVWSKPHRVGGSPLKGYQLDYYTLATPLHWQTVYDIQSEFHTIEGLDPEVSAWVLVRALNGHGLSPPSPVSKPMKTLQPDPNSGTNKNPWSVRAKLSSRSVILTDAGSVGSRKIKLNWELTIPPHFVKGFYIQIRESEETHYDAITISGGATRSHTLSDLRPNTRYFIFILPYFEDIQGRPSNIKIVKTEEDVPSASPERVKIQLINSSAALIQWHPPPLRDIHGDLIGYKLLTFVNETQDGNYTILRGVNSFVMEGLITEYETSYGTRVAVYNRRGVGPLSPFVSFEINPESHHPAIFGDARGGEKELERRREILLSPGQSPPHRGGFDLVLKEVWFVSFVSVMTIVLILSFALIICVRRKKGDVKNIGHYNVPTLKVDDITHVNFGDRDHLWFDTNWKNGESVVSNGKSGHLFVNRLNNNTRDGEYAEVEGLKSLPKDNNNEVEGLYATTSLVNESVSSKPSQSSSLTKEGVKSLEESNRGVVNNPASSSSSLNNRPSDHLPLPNKSVYHQASASTTSSSGDSMSKMLPQHFIESRDLCLFSSPISTKRGEDDLCRYNQIPPPKCLSYNRAGSFGSFGHRPGPSSFGPPLRDYGHSHYSVPGIFYHHAVDPFGKYCYDGSADEQYESVSICHYGRPPCYQQPQWHYPANLENRTKEDEDDRRTSGYCEGETSSNNATSRDSGPNWSFWESYDSENGTSHSEFKDIVGKRESSKQQECAQKSVSD